MEREQVKSDMTGLRTVAKVTPTTALFVSVILPVNRQIIPFF